VTEGFVQKWQDLYKIGVVSTILVNVLVISAVIAFFFWPFAVDLYSTEGIFSMLQTDRLGALISLDLLLLVISLINILPILALYVALKPVNESYALIALVLGLLGIILVVPARPLAEMVYLSDQWTAATTEAARIQMLAAGETLLSLFNGTAWMVFTILMAISGLITSLLMLRSKLFGHAVAYVGLISAIPGLGFFIPTFGPILLFVATFGGIVWYFMIARVFYRLGWRK
jgi:hypothetical protein